ncbi:MAG: efflux RND transporter periplasmic adaptor subunit [Gemmataceae bacterium]
MSDSETQPRPSKPRLRRKSRWLLPVLGTAVVAAVGAAGIVSYTSGFSTSKRVDLLLHSVKLESLPVSVVEKGTLESAENRDVICKVKAGSKGTFASTIKWVIDDGSVVTKGQLLAELDDSALQEQHKNQSIVVDKARAEFVKADEDYTITVKQNEADIAGAGAAQTVAELDLDKFLGVRVDMALEPLGAVIGPFGILTEKGEYRQKLDDVSGRLKQAESDLEAFKDRAAWANRSVKLGYLTPSQAKVEATKYAGSMDTVEKLTTEKYILENFTRRRDLTDLKAKLEVARIGVEKAVLQARAKEVQAESERKTKTSVLSQELDKLGDIDEQLRECKIFSPGDGMVVYYKPDSGRFSSSQQGLIAQGEQVKEGQKIMRIPDLRKMQVNTKVHEALVSRIRGDDRRSTGNYDSLRAGMLVNPDGLSRLFTQNEFTMGIVRDMFRDKEYFIASPGQQAAIKVDAFPDRVFSGRVRSVAAVASQQDWFSSDVKVYQTLVLIDGSVDGLKPDMNAEVTIHIDNSAEQVLAIPIQSVIGGAEAGPNRSVYVMSSGSPVETAVTLGKFNDKMIEVRQGLKDGDVVVLNPRKVLGDDSKTKTREEGESRGRSMPGGEKGEKGGKKGGSKGPGGPPAGAAGKGQPS